MTPRPASNVTLRYGVVRMRCPVCGWVYNAIARMDRAVGRLLDAAHLALGLVPADYPVRGADRQHATASGNYLGRTEG